MHGIPRKTILNGVTIFDPIGPLRQPYMLADAVWNVHLTEQAYHESWCGRAHLNAYMRASDCATVLDLARQGRGIPSAYVWGDKLDVEALYEWE